MHAPKQGRSRDNEELVRDWFGHLRGRHIGGNTLYTYESCALALLRFSRNTDLVKLSPRQIEAFLGRPREGRAHGAQGKPSTIARDLAVLRSLFRWMVAAGHIDRSPCDLVAAPRVPHDLPRAISDRVWLRLWDSELADDARVALGLGYFVGLRRAEITSLGPHHVDLKAGRLVRFRRKGGGDDTVPYESILNVLEQRLPTVLGDAGGGSFREALERLHRVRAACVTLMPWDHVPASAIQQRRHTLGDGQIDPQRIAKRLSTWQSRAGLGPKAFTTHAMRHSAITNLLRAGVPLAMVSKLANHANVQTTMGYAKLGEDELGAWLRSNRHGLGQL
jgi:integrase/recombinase XerC